MKTWIKIAIAVVLAVIIGVFVVYKFIYNKQHPDFENLDADFSFTVTEFYQKFKVNPVEAGKTYNGKIISLTGILSKVEIADSLVTAVFVMKQGDFGDEGIRCTMLRKYNLEAQKLQPDGEVRIKGYCTGYNETDVILEKCSILNQ
jgi:hypothetical protein